MAQMVHVEDCPICGSKIYVKLVGPHVAELPDEVWTCRCRQVYPDAFKRAGEHGYATGTRSQRRRIVHR